jgi:cation transport ATPase
MHRNYANPAQCSLPAGIKKFANEEEVKEHVKSMFLKKKEKITGDEKGKQEEEKDEKGKQEEEEEEEEKQERAERNSFLDFLQKAVFVSFFFFFFFLYIFIYFLFFIFFAVLPTTIQKPVCKTNFPDKLNYGPINIFNKVATKLALFLNGGGTTDNEAVTKGFYIN